MAEGVDTWYILHPTAAQRIKENSAILNSLLSPDHKLRLYNREGLELDESRCIQSASENFWIPEELAKLLDDSLTKGTTRFCPQPWRKGFNPGYSSASTNIILQSEERAHCELFASQHVEMQKSLDLGGVVAILKGVKRYTVRNSKTLVVALQFFKFKAEKKTPEECDSEGVALQQDAMPWENTRKIVLLGDSATPQTTKDCDIISKEWDFQKAFLNQDEDEENDSSPTNDGDATHEGGRLGTEIDFSDDDEERDGYSTDESTEQLSGVTVTSFYTDDKGRFVKASNLHSVLLGHRLSTAPVSDGSNTDNDAVRTESDGSIDQE